MTTPYAPIWLTPSAPGQLSNNYGERGDPFTAGTPTVVGSGGATSLPAGTYAFVVTYQNRKGQSLPSQSASATISAGGSVSITTKAMPIDAWYANFYLVSAPPGATLGFLAQLQTSGTSTLTLTYNSPTQGQPSKTPPTIDSSADGIRLKARYLSPNNSDSPGQVRVTATKTVLRGSSTTPQVVWDSGWLGNPATTPVPDANLLNIGPNCCAISVPNNRVYVFAQSQDNFVGYAGLVLSAPVNGGSVGSWRYENPVTVTGTTSNNDYPTGLVAIGNRLYAGTSGGIWVANINTANGALGPWSLAYTFPGTGLSFSGAAMNGFDYGSFARAPAFVNFFPSAAGGTLIVTNPATTTSTTVQAFLVSGTDGSITGPNAFPSLTTGVQDPAIWATSVAAIYLIGGTDANTGNPIATVQYIGYNAAGGNQNGVAPTTWTAGANLPIARAAFAFAQDSYYMSVFGEWGTCFVMGGVGGADTFEAPSNKVYYLDANTMQTPGSSWHLAAHTLPTPVYAGGGALLGNQNFADGFPNATPLGGYMAVIAGLNLTPNFETQTVVQATTRPDAADVAWYSGPGSAFTSAPLGSGGAVATNSDGSVDVSFMYNLGAGVTSPGAGGSPSALYDGDQVQLAVQFTDSMNGDPSPTATTLISIGQPPQIVNATPAGAIFTGAPTAGFAYLAGAGGATQATWRLQVLAPGGQVVFDTGARLDQADSVPVAVAPLLLVGTPYTFQFTVTSGDTPLNATDSNAATVTTTVTPQYTPPLAPTGLNVTTDGTRCAALITPTNSGMAQPGSPIGTVPFAPGAPSSDATTVRLGQSPVPGTVVPHVTMGVAWSQPTRMLPAMRRPPNAGIVSTSSSAAAQGVPRTFAGRPSGRFGGWLLATAAARLTRSIPRAATLRRDSTLLTPSVAPEFNRIYYRRTGTSQWLLLVDSVPAGPGTSPTVTQMDQLAMGASYDFAASALDGGQAAESAMTAPVTGVVIPTPANGATSMLHIQGQGPSSFVSLMLDGGPVVKGYVDHVADYMLGLAAPVVRYGLAVYREFAIKAKLLDLPADPLAAGTFASLEAVFALLTAGQVGVFRTAAGTMVTVALASTSTSITTGLTGMSFLPASYLSQRELTLTLLQIPNQYQPSTAQGSALGLLQQQNGSVVPLNVLEQAL